LAGDLGTVDGVRIGQSRLRTASRQQCDGDLYWHHTNQAGGAPGTSGGTAGYGTGTETGVTVNVVAGSGNTVTGNTAGIYLGATS
jgi:hypothetical protein